MRSKRRRTHLLLNCMQSQYKRSISLSVRALAIYKTAEKVQRLASASFRIARSCEKRCPWSRNDRGDDSKNIDGGASPSTSTYYHARCAINNSGPLARVRSRVTRKSYGDYSGRAATEGFSALRLRLFLSWYFLGLQKGRGKGHVRSTPRPYHPNSIPEGPP